ncbi:MAG TPA: ABC-F family ATP-binding cassette domain-containing protein [Pseudogracilibacillus sp.]|nr:ABC-F family ATP-binding cassette domain-containing protein [Pseudogracilibacillus sp.]
MLTVEGLKKSYGDKLLFENINVLIKNNERIGLIGVNGTGKSTFLKILAGIEHADAGEINHPNDYRIEYLPQNPDMNGEMKVIDYIYAGEADIMKAMREYEHALINLENHPEDEKAQNKLLDCQQTMDKYDAWEASTVAKTVLTQMGVTSFDKQIKYLSGGQKKRVAIAKTLIQPVNLLILDEPTNHLDNETIIWLEQYLTRYQGALLLVTHDRYFLDRITNRIYELDNGSLYVYEGNYEIFLEQKAEREILEHSLAEKHQNTLKRELAWLRRGPRARSTKQRARIERIDKLKQETFNLSDENVEIQTGSTRLGKQVIEVENLSKSIANKQLFTNFSYLIGPGDRIGIIGPNGSGKSTLLNIISGRLKPDAGTISIGETVKIGYYTQGEDELNEDERIIEYIKEVAEVIKTKDDKIITAEQMLERFLFSRAQQWSYIKSLSGGERRRLYLLKILMTEPNVIILDEPTNDLDIKTLGILEDYLEHFPGVVLTVSHDRYFLDQVVDELIVFDGQGHVEHFYGNYSEYAEQVKEEKLARTKVKQVQKTQPPKKEKTKLSYHEQKEWETIEDEIEALETKIENLKTQIAAEGSNIEVVQELFKEQQTLESQLEIKMERWEELSLLVESFIK